MMGTIPVSEKEVARIVAERKAMDRRRLEISFGALSPALAEQISAYGLNLDCSQYQRDADAVTRLSVRGILPDGEARKARRRILKAMTKLLLEKEAAKSLMQMPPSGANQLNNSLRAQDVAIAALKAALTKINPNERVEIIGEFCNEWNKRCEAIAATQDEVKVLVGEVDPPNMSVTWYGDSLKKLDGMRSAPFKPIKLYAITAQSQTKEKV